MQAHRVLLPTLVVLPCLAVGARAAHADELGHRGQLVLSCELDGSSTCAGGVRFDGYAATRISPRLDVFIADRWSLGATLTHSTERAEGFGGMTTTTVELRAGRYVRLGDRLGDRLGAWPQLGVTRTSVESDAVGVLGGYAPSFTVARVPLVVTPVPHVWLALAPEVAMNDEVVAVSTSLFAGVYW